jgi:anti-anti-sigma factor
MASLDRIEAGLQSFRAEVRRRPTGPWLRLSGELDLATAPDLEQHLRALEEGEGIRIVLDLSELAFMDSAGLAVILEAERRAGTGASSSGARHVRPPGCCSRPGLACR